MTAPAPQILRGARLALWRFSQQYPTNFALMARVEGTLDPAAVQRALDQLEHTYPAALMTVAEAETDCPRLQRDSAVHLATTILERTPATPWQTVVAAQLSQPFDLTTEPPVRLVWLRGEGEFELVLVLHHAFADGFSALYLLRNVLTFLGDPQARREPVPLSPPMGELIPAFAGKRAVVGWAKVKAALLGMLLRLRRGEASPVALPAPAYTLQTWDLAPDPTAALVARCRTEGTTVQGALVVAFARAFATLDGQWRRRVHCPINLRQRLTQPVGEAFGLYIRLVEFAIDCDPQRDFWPVAREVKQTLAAHTGDGPIFSAFTDTTILLNTLGMAIPAATIAQQMMAVTHDLSITNLGRLALPTTYGSLQIKALYGPAVGGVPGEAVLGVLTLAGRLNFTLVLPQKTASLAGETRLRGVAMDQLAQAVGISFSQ